MTKREFQDFLSNKLDRDPTIKIYEDGYKFNVYLTLKKTFDPNKRFLKKLQSGKGAIDSDQALYVQAKYQRWLDELL